MKTIHNMLQFVKDLIAIAAIISLIVWAILEKQYGLVYSFTALALLTMIGVICGFIWIEINRRRGIYPQKGQVTMADVKRLALNDHSILAINAYRAIHHVTLRKAKQEVNKIIAESLTET